MGKLRRLILPLVTTLTILAASLGFAAAATNKNVDVSGNNNHTLYKAGQTVNITGNVSGDVFCAGQTVTVNANVSGDVICAGQTVTVDGKVQGNVRLAGQTINLNGQVQKSATLAAQSLTVSSGASIGQDATLLASTALVDGSVQRDIHGAVRDVTLNGRVGRNVDMQVDRLSLASGANIAGNVDYTSKNHVDQVPAAKIGGKITQHQPSAQKHPGRTFRAWLVASLFGLAFLLLFSLALVIFVPHLFRGWSMELRNRPWWTLLTGFLATLIFPIVLIALLVSIIGLPFGLFLILVALIVAALSLPATAFAVGELVLGRHGQAFLSILVGVLLLWLVSLIPILGGIVMLFAFWFGIGAVLTYAWRHYTRPHYAHDHKINVREAK